MLYLIGLGLNEKGITLEGVGAIEKCSKVYLENYTVDFPYDISELGLSEETMKLTRGDVESNLLIKEAKKEDVALLVYGSPLFATTHITLILEAKKAGIKTKVIYAASIFDAVAETGLQLYKFGKISSMPTWTENYKPDSFLDFVEQNLSIKAHSLLLIDIGLPIEKALEQLERASEKRKLNLDKIVICKKMGTHKSKIYYGKISDLKKQKIKNPFAFIIPGELHFLEKEALESYTTK
jgi:diphthine synthase